MKEKELQLQSPALPLLLLEQPEPGVHGIMGGAGLEILKFP